MKIIFLGEDSFSAAALNSLIDDAKCELLAVFCPIYDNFIYARLKKTCEINGIPFYRVENINSQHCENLIYKMNPDLISAVHFQKILKKNIIQIPKYGCINLHPSLLPNYRGLAPIQWPIINGDKQTGVTVHFINEGVDTGDIILQHKINITNDMYVSDLQLKLLEVYKFVVKDVIGLMVKGKMKLTSQKELKGSYFGKLKHKECEINLEKGVISAYNLIRGVSRPYLGATFNEYHIWKARLASNETNQSINSKYNMNSIFFDDDLGTFIKFKNGSLILEKYNKLKFE